MGPETYQTEADRKNRRDLRIQPTSRAFHDRFAFFQEELGSSKTIYQILRENFTQLETANIVPGAVNIQCSEEYLKANAERYHDLLDARFKDYRERSGLSLKMTMLYFGLSVEAEALPSEATLNLEDEEILQDDKHETSAALRAKPTGILDSEEVRDLDNKASRDGQILKQEWIKSEEQSISSLTHGKVLNVYGFQGCVQCFVDDIDSFNHAIQQLLSLHSGREKDSSFTIYWYPRDEFDGFSGPIKCHSDSFPVSRCSMTWKLSKLTAIYKTFVLREETQVGSPQPPLRPAPTATMDDIIPIHWSDPEPNHEYPPSISEGVEKLVHTAYFPVPKNKGEVTLFRGFANWGQWRLQATLRVLVGPPEDGINHCIYGFSQGSSEILAGYGLFTIPVGTLLSLRRCSRDNAAAQTTPLNSEVRLFYQPLPKETLSFVLPGYCPPLEKARSCCLPPDTSSRFKSLGSKAIDIVKDLLCSCYGTLENIICADIVLLDRRSLRTLRAKTLRKVRVQVRPLSGIELARRSFFSPLNLGLFLDRWVQPKQLCLVQPFFEERWMHHGWAGSGEGGKGEDSSPFPTFPQSQSEIYRHLSKASSILPDDCFTIRPYRIEQIPKVSGIEDNALVRNSPENASTVYPLEDGINQDGSGWSKDELPLFANYCHLDIDFMSRQPLVPEQFSKPPFSNEFGPRYMEKSLKTRNGTYKFTFAPAKRISKSSEVQGKSNQSVTTKKTGNGLLRTLTKSRSLIPGPKNKITPEIKKVRYDLVAPVKALPAEALPQKVLNEGADVSLHMLKRSPDELLRFFTEHKEATEIGWKEFIESIQPFLEYQSTDMLRVLLAAARKRMILDFSRNTLDFNTSYEDGAILTMLKKNEISNLSCLVCSTTEEQLDWVIHCTKTVLFNRNDSANPVDNADSLTDALSSLGVVDSHQVQANSNDVLGEKLSKEEVSDLILRLSQDGRRCFMSLAELKISVLRNRDRQSQWEALLGNLENIPPEQSLTLLTIVLDYLPDDLKDFLKLVRRPETQIKCEVDWKSAPEGTVKLPNPDIEVSETLEGNGNNLEKVTKDIWKLQQEGETNIKREEADTMLKFVAPYRADGFGHASDLKKGSNPVSCEIPQSKSSLGNYSPVVNSFMPSPGALTAPSYDSPNGRDKETILERKIASPQDSSVLEAERDADSRIILHKDRARSERDWAEWRTAQDEWPGVRLGRDGQVSEPDYRPAGDVYCSRCLMKIPIPDNDGNLSQMSASEKLIRMHTDPSLSCGIPNRFGCLEALPNLSGWILVEEFRRTKMSINALRNEFRNRFPKYARTICSPKEGSDFSVIWRRDVNRESNKEFHQLPWPPPLYPSSRPDMSQNNHQPPPSATDSDARKDGEVAASVKTSSTVENTHKHTGRGKKRKRKGDKNYNYISDTDSDDMLEPDVNDLDRPRKKRRKILDPTFRPKNNDGDEEDEDMNMRAAQRTRKRKRGMD